jgi:hypothetical protein
MAPEMYDILSRIERHLSVIAEHMVLQEKKVSERYNTSRKYNNPSREEFATLIKAILLQRGQPMTITDIIHKLKERGTTIKSTDEYRLVSTALWRSRDTIQKLGYKRGYWPVGVELPK